MELYISEAFIENEVHMSSVESSVFCCCLFPEKFSSFVGDISLCGEANLTYMYQREERSNTLRKTFSRNKLIN